MTANSAPNPKSTDRVSAKPDGKDVESSSETAEPNKPAEVGGRGGLDPTRYGDWEKNGRCIDF